MKARIKWAKIAIVVMACLIFIWGLAFLAVAQDNGYSLQSVWYTCKIVCIAVAVGSFLYLFVWLGSNWIMED
jgi:uncharacterized membrane protein SirB2